MIAFILGTDAMPDDKIMIGLLQRVSAAKVDVDHQTIGAIGAGLLVFVCAEREDNVPSADRLLERILSYRVFSDHEGKMNLCLGDVNGGLLLVPQFTLAADTNKGTRPSFSPAAPPELGLKLYSHMVARASELHSPFATGRFGADMQVSLTNDGPVTLLLRS